MPLVEVRGARLNYLQVGPAENPAAEDLVMVHGLATNLAFWFMPHAQHFAQRYRVTVFDLRGHGRSQMTPDGYRPQDLAGDLAGLLDALGIARAHIVAHSYGGVVALGMACRQPERIASLVLADTHLSSARERGDQAAAWSDEGRVRAALSRAGLSLDPRDPYFGYRLLTEVAQLQREQLTVPADVAELVGPLMSRVGARTASQWLKLMRETQAERELMADDGLCLEMLGRLQFPILAMYGDHSQARLTGAQLREVWPHAQLRRVRDAGHFFPSTRPQEVIDSCERFWAGQPVVPRTPRQGEPRANHFRSDRVYLDEGGWYFQTREDGRMGPFPEQEEAQRELSAYVQRMQAEAPLRARSS